jgi:C_GCAxxG_C_C family probable redox protein
MNDSNSEPVTAENKTEEFFLEGYACAQSVVLAFADRFDLPEDTAKRMASTFGGGMGRLRKTCGALTGAYMVLGLHFGNTEPHDMDNKLNSYSKVRELTRRFEDLYGETDCGPLIRRHANAAEIKDRNHHRLICNQLVRSVHELLEEMLEEG